MSRLSQEYEPEDNDDDWDDEDEYTMYTKRRAIIINGEVVGFVEEEDS